MNNTADNSAGDIEKRGSPERFGFSWDKFSEMSPEQEEQFRRWTSLIPENEWEGKQFLDVGCGAGRNSFWAMKYRAAGGLAIDLDERSLKAAQNNLSSFPSVEVKRCSIYELNRKNTFDIAFSIGVIHHLAQPEEAVRKMAHAVKPGGKVLVWLYGYENNEWIVRFADPLRKIFFSKLPLSIVHLLSVFPSAILWLLVRLNVIQIEYFRMLRKFPFRHIRHIVFDQMIPRIALYYRRKEAIDLLKQAGLKNIQTEWVNEMSWTVLGTKPDKETAL